MADISSAIDSWCRAHDPALFTGGSSMHTAEALRASAAVDAAYRASPAPGGAAAPPLALAGAGVGGSGLAAAQTLAEAAAKCLASGGATGSDYLAALTAAPATALVMMTSLARQRAAFDPASAAPSGAQFNRYTTALSQNPLLSLLSSGSQTAADASFSSADALLANVAAFLGGALPDNIAAGLAGAVTALGASKAPASAAVDLFAFNLQITGSDGRSGITLDMSGSTWQLAYTPATKKERQKAAVYTANNTGVVVASFAFNTALWTPPVVSRMAPSFTSVLSFADWVAQNSTGK